MLGKFSATIPQLGCPDPTNVSKLHTHFFFFIFEKESLMLTDFQTPSVTEEDAEPLIPLPLSDQRACAITPGSYTAGDGTQGPVGQRASSPPTGPHLQPGA